MMQTAYPKAVAGACAAAALLAAACLGTGAIAVDFHFEAFSDPLLALQYAHRHEWMYWFYIFDLWGYYLLLLPVLLLMHQRYRFHHPWMPLVTFSGAAYILGGAMGAAQLAAQWPPLMQAYPGASAGGKEVLEQLFAFSTRGVVDGLWNSLGMLLGGVWWLGLGRLLYRDARALGLLTLMLGASCLLDGFGQQFRLPALAAIGLNIYLVAHIVWAAALAVSLARNARTEQPAVPSGALRPEAV
ncbi:MAG TPA: hypothetical protein VHK69_07215 [Chitinophagaceae bacterium]|nr:hypothetical protein [Chitinophagaceae bacterium]